MDLFTATLELIIVIAAVFGLAYLISLVLNTISRGSVNDRKGNAEAEEIEARAAKVRASAAQVLKFADHYHGIYTGDEYEIDGKTMHFIPVHIPPAPIVNQGGEVLPADEVKILRALSQLIEVSIAHYTDQGVQIEPANLIDGQLGMKWQDVVDYAQTQGWVQTQGKQGTYCKPPTSNLAALRLAVAFRSLPRRENRPTA